MQYKQRKSKIPKNIFKEDKVFRETLTGGNKEKNNTDKSTDDETLFTEQRILFQLMVW